MRLVTFSGGRSERRLGAVLGPWNDWHSIVDLNAADRRLPPDMLAFVDACGSLWGASWSLAKETVGRAARLASKKGAKYVHAASDVTIHVPIRPRLLRDFIAFRGHIARTRAALGSTVPPEWDAVPAYYNGNHLNVVGPDEVVPVLRYPSERGAVETTKLDYEAELGFVLGRGGRAIDAARASRCLFGVTIFNDFSARDLQFVATKIGMGPGPGKDWVNALGPCVVTRDEFGALDAQRVVVRVNGRVRLDGRYRDLVYRNPHVAEGERPLWRFEEIVEFLSEGQEIHAGEVWGSGTIPGGCEFERGDGAEYLRPGDVVEIEVEGIGVLRNPVAGVARKG